jgi:hypothetical protein
MTADETIDPQDASKNPIIPPQKPAAIPAQPVSATPPEPEPVILEERVIIAAPEPAKVKAPIVPKKPVPQPAPVQPIPAAPGPGVPHEAKVIPQLVVPNPDPNFKPTILGGETLQDFAKRPDSPVGKSRASQTARSPEEDIAQILKGVKLPERRDYKGIADIKKAEPEPVEEPPKTDTNKSVVATTQAGLSEPASSIVQPLRTLKDDLQTIVRDQKISLVHAVSLEEEKKRGQAHLSPEQTDIRSKRSRRTAAILFFSGLFVILGLAALFGVYYVAQEQASVPPAPQTSILFAEQTVSFSLDNQSGQDLKNSLASARTKQLGNLGSITRVVPTIEATTSSGQLQEQPATIQQFFSALGMNPPAELMSAIGPQFFFGFHVVDTNAPLLVIPVTSYDHAFAGMLAWEPTMDQDLAPVFTSVPATMQVNGLPVQRTFQDEVLRNYDVRELTDDQGNVVLYYSFPTPTILVIAQSPYSFTEILSRLQAAGEL